MTASDQPTTVVARSAEELLEASWGRRGRPLDRRETVVEVLASLVFVLGCVALLLATGAPPALHVAAVPLVVSYAIATRVNFPLGAAGTIPTQLFLVPMLIIVPAPMVPVLVAVGLTLGSVAWWATGRGRLDRVLCVGGDAIHALGPALVLVLVGRAEGLDGELWLWPALLVAQYAFDLISGLTREWHISQVHSPVQLRVLVQVWSVDTALTPAGLLAALALDEHTVAPIALLPLVGLMAYAARDRNQRIDSAHERLRALEVERERLRQAVRRIGEAFSASSDADSIMTIVMRTVADALHASAARVTSGGRLVVGAAWDGDAGPDVHAVLAAAERAAATADGVTAVADAGAHALLCPLPELGCALLVGRPGEPFDEDERDLLAYLVVAADSAASHALRMDLVKRQAVTDELTGLANHRRFQEVLDHAVGRNAASGETVALILLDLDNFKRVNDQHGHQTGDVVLQAVGRCLRESCRANDEPARYGGEELAVVLVGPTPPQALAFAERIRQSIQAVEVRTPEDERLDVSASLGVSWLGGDITTKAQLVAAADRALYDAKHMGKNRVEWIDPSGRAAVLSS